MRLALIPAPVDKYACHRKLLWNGVNPELNLDEKVGLGRIQS